MLSLNSYSLVAIGLVTFELGCSAETTPPDRTTPPTPTNEGGGTDGSTAPIEKMRTEGKVQMGHLLMAARYGSAN